MRSMALALDRLFLTVGLVALVSMFAAGCSREPMPAQAGAPVASAPVASAPVTWQAGAALADARAVTVAELFASPDVHRDHAVRVQGDVKAVCQNRGCWVELRDGEQALIVKSLDHGIAFPKDGVGQRMLVEGVFRVDVPESCGDGHAHGAGEGGEGAHECPKPKMLVEVRRAELRAGS